ncbi:MAG: biotin--[acetyl-CoA-carboxylase] ligase [Nitrosomonas sp.]|uniref:biotin--[acetyl-CoA-carboxylase] ligase n=1 Tax=Nitrosomonas sp. JL21 TaxID=153949 RepID=UPI00136CC43F|nr:biotin--[acetyl-CoA-carboxylase] ligase [Nitrosomonas sp.]MCC7091872.1 biotin--[acetyl-CoA-carboxylase] ligase [Nitrosomonas sp.]
MQWLDSERILNEAKLSNDSYEITIIDVTKSTNNYLLDQYKEKYIDNQRNPKNTSIVAAELQTSGRGRFDRRWYSGLGGSLTFSIGRWCKQEDISAFAGLSLVIGLAILRTLNHYSIFDVCLKWPNDIVSDARYQKLAGVLVDFKSHAHRLSYAVIGIGINFNLNNEVKAHIEYPVTDLYSLSGRMIDRSVFCGTLLAKLHHMLIDFEKYGFTYFKEEWISSHAFEEKVINLILPDCSVIEGIARGIGDDGSLRLVTEQGTKSFHVGDVSLRIKNDGTQYIND